MRRFGGVNTEAVFVQITPWTTKEKLLMKFILLCINKWKQDLQMKAQQVEEQLLTIIRCSVACKFREVFLNFGLPRQHLLCQQVLFIQEQDDRNGPQPPERNRDDK